MAPMFDVDLNALEQGCHQGAEDGDGLWRRGVGVRIVFHPIAIVVNTSRRKLMPPSQPLAAKALMNTLWGSLPNNLRNCIGTHAVGQIKQQGQAVELIAETAGLAGVIVVDEIGALLK